MAEQNEGGAKAPAARTSPKASTENAGNENPGSGLKVGQEVTLRAKVMDVTHGTGLNCVLHVLALDKDGKPVEEAHAPRFAASSAWCGKV